MVIDKKDLDYWESSAKNFWWEKPWDQVLKNDHPYYRWFSGARTNIVSNIFKTDKDKLALIWEGQDGTVKKYTFGQMEDEVNKIAGGLVNLGIKKGDVVSIYLPKIPETIFCMLAVAKIGAIHSVVFSGFGHQALRDRLIDCQTKVLIYLPKYPYRNKTIDCQHNVDLATENLNIITITPDKLSNNSKISNFKFQIVNSGDPLFILYTSGTTNKPKGVMHGHAGYMVGVAETFKKVFEPKDDDIFWCTADCGWITGHSYIVYGPLLNGTTIYMYEGAPDYPDVGIWWRLIEKHKITKFYTAPTAIRGLMRFGSEWPEKSDLSSLQLLGSVGEPLNPEARDWMDEHIGHKKCPIKDTWWQTETGMILNIGKPIVPDSLKIIDGQLVVTKPWPSQFLGILNNDEIYRKLYWERIDGVYFTGDRAEIDENGNIRILGRNDDVISISGHRLASAEMEAVVDSVPSVCESAVIGIPDEIKGEKIKIFAILENGVKPSDQIKAEILAHFKASFGALGVAEEIEFVPNLPKTRSGKIMRRLLRAQETGESIGDTSTLDE